MAANLTTKLGQLVDVLTPDTTNTRIGVANASPTRTLDVTGTFGASGASTLGGALTYGGITLSNAVTGTGNMVLSASPTFTGTIIAAGATFSSPVTINDSTEVQLTMGGSNASQGRLRTQWDGTGAAGRVTLSAKNIAGTLTDVFRINGEGVLSTLLGPLNYGGVTLSNAVTGTGNMVLSASPTLTGTLTAATANFSGTVALTGTGGMTLTNAQSATTRIEVTNTSTNAAASAAFTLANSTNGGRLEMFSTGATPYGILQPGFVALYQNNYAAGGLALGAQNGPIIFSAASGGGLAEAMRLDTGGRLQVGTTAGTGRINMANSGGGLNQINSTGGAQEILNLYSDNNLYFSAPSNIIIRPGGGGEAARFGTNGNLGIGVTPVYSGLDISKTVTMGAATPVANTYPYPAGKYFQVMQIGADSNDYYMGFFGGYAYSASTVNILLQAKVGNTSQSCGNYISGDTTAVLAFGSLTAAATTGGNATKNEYARFDTSGNLLVGTTTASSVLSVVSASSIIGYYNSTAANGSYSVWANSGTQNGVIGSAKSLFTSGTLSNFGIRAENNLIFGIGSNEAARIDTSGRFTVGSSSSPDGGNITAFTTGAASAEMNIVCASGTSNKESILNFGSTITGSTRYSGRITYWNSDNTLRLYAPTTLTSAITISSSGAVAVAGALSKGSGSFRIDHPVPALTETHQLVHSFIEGPKADLIYRGKAELVAGAASINIDTVSTMTEGTFVVLCRDVQCFTTNESDWTPVRGSVSGNILTIVAQDDTSTAAISWMVIGERQDKHIMETEWTDEDGRVIVEPLKPVDATVTEETAENALESK